MQKLQGPGISWLEMEGWPAARDILFLLRVAGLSFNTVIAYRSLGCSWGRDFETCMGTGCVGSLTRQQATWFHLWMPVSAFFSLFDSSFVLRRTGNCHE